VKGEVRIASFTAEPLALVDYRTLLREDGSPALTITGGRVAKGGVVVRTQEIETASRPRPPAACGSTSRAPSCPSPKTRRILHR